jgi:hypothetical protein
MVKELLILWLIGIFNFSQYLKAVKEAYSPNSIVNSPLGD